MPNLYGVPIIIPRNENFVRAHENYKVLAAHEHLSAHQRYGGFFRLPPPLHLPTASPRRPCPPISGDPLHASKPLLSASLTLQTLKARILDCAHAPVSSKRRVLPFKNGCPLAVSSSPPAGVGVGPLWRLGWLGLDEFGSYLARFGVEFGEEMLVYLDSNDCDASSYWAIDLSPVFNLAVPEWEDGGRSSFVELRTLMVASDLTDELTMGELAIAGRGKALLEWHITTRFCGYCATRTAPIDLGGRKECTNELCRRRVYPRVDPVVIMLVIDEENDRVLLSRQSRYAPQRWTCLAGFMEPGESLEEAITRETWEETGIEVDKVVYHTSRPWPVGRNGMPCQLMVGFFAYAKTFETFVDKVELEDAKWHSRQEVKRALTSVVHKKAQRSAAARIDHMCRGAEKSQIVSSDVIVERGEEPPMSVPGPYTIAHDLISSWIYQGT